SFRLEVEHRRRLGVELDVKKNLRLLHQSVQLFPTERRRLQDVVRRPGLEFQPQLARLLAKGGAWQNTQIEDLHIVVQAIVLEVMHTATNRVGRVPRQTDDEIDL